MPVIHWSKEISVGIDMLDDEHVRLLEILNDFYDAMLVEKGSEVLETSLDSLLAYATAHFKHEEDLFTETAYPEAETHKMRHREAMQRILEIQSKLKTEPSVDLCNELFEFLTRWLTEHILGDDQKYTAHFRAHGIR
ncbi:MAG: bacteriohemerythrin [Alphaproteobacteria bacterium]|nr:bacteriohemerythrin [Alphaproteobacteria bacterium]